MLQTKRVNGSAPQASQEVLDYQGEAYGFYIYAKGWNVWVINISIILFTIVSISFAIIQNDPTLLAPPATPALPEIPATPVLPEIPATPVSPEIPATSIV